MARQLPHFSSTGISRKLVILTVGGALCMGAGGTAGWSAQAPAQAAALPAADMSTVHLTGQARAAWPAFGLPSLISVSGEVVLQDAQRIVSVHARSLADALAATARQAARTEARRLAARAAAAAAQAAAQRADAEAAAQQAAAQQAAQQAAAQAAAQQAARQVPSGSPQQIAAQLLGQFGWQSSQFSCLDALWARESGWNAYAQNPSTGAYGIPQALPGSKMASAGADWQTGAATQIRWGLTYIQGRYGSPCGAWAHEEADGWY